MNEINEMIESFRKKYPIKSFLWQLWKKVEDLKYISFEIKCFFQRGIRGWSDKDWWNLDCHVSNIIVGSLKKLKKEGHILPTLKKGKSEEKAKKEWNKILDTIIYTFEMAKKFNKNEVIIIENYKNRQEAFKMYKRLNKKYLDYSTKVLTAKEIQKYKKGWKLFEQYFNSLWD